MVVSLLREKNMAFDFFKKREREEAEQEIRNQQQQQQQKRARRLFSKGGAFAFVFLS